MAGKPGKSGGVRPGAGRKPAEAVKIDIPVPVLDNLSHKDPKVFLMALMNDLEADIKIRADAAKSLLPFMHAKVEAGVKDAKAEAAKKAGAGKFGAAAPPLRIVNGR